MNVLKHHEGYNSLLDLNKHFFLQLAGHRVRWRDVTNNGVQPRRLRCEVKEVHEGQDHGARRGSMYFGLKKLH